MSALVLTYSHNVIEHLGLKLYQNRPTRVVAELVSNSWDADADEAWIEMNMGDNPAERWIAVHDSGHGMTRQAIADRFLVIGAPKRASPSERSPKSRPLMGRKGIGKLAPFGIASNVDVITSATSEAGHSVMWLRLNLPGIKAQAQVGESAKYEPIIIVDQGTVEDLANHVDDVTGQVAKFAKRLQEGGGTGTLVLLRSLSVMRGMREEALIEALGRRFTATSGRGFSVFVNGTKVDAAVSLPAFDFRIPDDGFTTENVDGNEVRFWVGFVSSAKWPADEAGVGVYAHYKICQDRPFTFGVKGKEIFSRYMYAVVEADWLDELADDLISTDRTNLNWDAEPLAALHDWGRGKVGQWITKFEAFRNGTEKQRNKERLARGIEKMDVPAITEQEQEQVAELLSEITPSMPRDEDGEAAKDRLAKAVATAWLQEPMRELIQQVWSQLGTGDATAPAVFSGLVEKLVEYSIPESLNLAVVFAQRAFALTKLYDYVHNGREVDLQRLLEDFPWIIEPDSVYLTANQNLRTVIKTAEEQGHIPSGRQRVVAGTPEENRPDFVFFSSPEDTRIVVVELKSPQHDLNIDNREQLAGYLNYLEAHYQHAKLHGYLVGRVPTGGFRIQRNDMEVIPWTDIMQRSRSRYVTFLAAMLANVPASRDARVDQVRDFAGKEVWDLLQKIALKNQRLADVIREYDQ